MHDQTECWVRVGWVAVLGTAIASSPVAVQAQITPDNTLGAEASAVGNGAVNGNPVQLIEGGAARGSNLFHSFSEFNVGTGEAVYFGNPVGIENILSRVTGGDISNIDGLLGVDGGANLFLLNPNGILFGPDAQLDIAGAFTASAGERFAFADGNEFSATSPQAGGLLTVSVPLGVQLNDAAQGDIVNQGALEVNGGQSLTLFGNRVENRGGRLVARGGGDIVLVTPQAAGSEVLVDGGTTSTSVLIGSTLDGGDVLVTTHDLTVQNDGSIAASTFGQGNAGQVQIVASGNVIVEDDSSFIGSQVGPDAVGDSGGVVITTTNLSVLNDAEVSASTFGQGNSGQVQIVASENVIVEGEGLAISSQVGPDAVGDSGGVNITTTNFSVLNAAQQVDASTFGQGNSGLVEIVASGNVIVEGEGLAISSQVGLGAVGDSGGVSITTTTLSVLDGAIVSASTFGQGDSGQVQIEAIGDVIVEGERSLIHSQVGPDAVGNSGGISITTANLYVLDGAQISPSTGGQGDSGQVQIEAIGDVIVEGDSSGIGSEVNPLARGDSGGVSITTANLSVLNGAVVSAGTLGQGNAGQVQIAATGDVVVGGSFIASQVGSDAVGDSGGVDITTTNLSVLDDAAVTASTEGQGNSGPVQIAATGDIVVEGQHSGINSLVFEGAMGDSGGIDITTTNLSVLDDAAVTASTGGQGNSGPVQIAATGDIVVKGERSVLASIVGPEAVGDSGGVSITTATLSVLDDAAVTASTFGEGDAGPMRIGADEITLSSSNSEITAETFSSGDGGGLQLVALEDALTVSGPGGLGVGTSSTGTAGNIEVTAERFTLTDGVILSAGTAGPSIGGNITVTADETTLRNGSRMTVSSSGTEPGGNLTLTGKQLTLEDGSLITAETASTDGGNLTFTLDDYLLLRDGSTISTDAGTDTAGGNGGNITLNLADGFIVAVPEEDSDITANAFAGDGGNVTVIARSLLGIAFRPQETPLSDITASSQFGNSGTVSITELSPDVVQAESELPVETAPPPLAAGCRAPGAQSGSFVITGRGGLPTNPIDVLEADSIWQDLAPLTETDEADASSTLPAAEPEVAAPNEPLVQAQGWTRNADGTVTLLAHRSETPAPFELPNGCDLHPTEVAL
ncbi:MAG: filamentous hemagglutinin N-terminal domain-containing protein [Leptolyngbya sp. SIO1E4]|nr:filamentous hemagglutinin N-terminal domain-containing protein [Leptolyngbya sp. SIO1E4]